MMTFENKEKRITITDVSKLGALEENDHHPLNFIDHPMRHFSVRVGTDRSLFGEKCRSRASPA